jgi:hypothetical protein
MRRPILFAILSFLLVSMQHDGLVHPFEHLSSQLARSDKTALALPDAGDACAHCALLAAGSHVVLGDLPVLHSVSSVVESATFAFRSRAADFPASFSSRAPPVLL